MKFLLVEALCLMVIYVVVMIGLLDLVPAFLLDDPHHPGCADSHLGRKRLGSCRSSTSFAVTCTSGLLSFDGPSLPKTSSPLPEVIN